MASRPWTRSIGNQRVLDVLADTVVPVAPLDLDPHGPPECDPHAARPSIPAVHALGRPFFTMTRLCPRSDVLGTAPTVPRDPPPA